MSEREVLAILKGSSPEVKALALETRKLVLSLFPGAVETVHPGWGNVTWGRSARMKEQLFAVCPLKDRVNLGVWNGATLDDPDGLLEGTGKSVRHVKIRDTAALKKAALKRLLKAALAAEANPRTACPVRRSHAETVL